MEKVISVLKSNQAKTFYWTTLNSVIALVVLYLQGESFVYAPVVIAGLNLVTKAINKEFLS